MSEYFFLHVCRTLIANALRKKQFYKEAIRVEAIPSGAQLDSNKPLAGDWFKWDPISSGEGDLLLEDMAKSFSASSKVSKTVKAIDFASVIGSMPSHGFQVKALITQTEAVPQPLDNRKISLSAAEIVEVPVAGSGLPEQLDSLDLPKSDQTLVYDTPLIHQASGCENSQNLHSPSDTAKGFTNSEEIRTPTTSSKVEKENPNGLDVNLALNVAEKHDMKLRKCFSSCESQIVIPNENVVFHASTQDLELDVACDAAKGFTNSEEIRTTTTSSKVEKENPNGLDVNLALTVAEKHDLKLRKCFSSCESQIVLPNENVVFHASTQDLELDVACDADSKRELLIPSEDIGLPAPLNEESKSTKSSDEVLGIAMDGVSMEVDMTNQEDTCLALNDLPLPEPFLEREQFREPGNDVAILADQLPIPESHIEMTIIDDSSAANHESTEVTMEEKRHEEADTRGQNPTRSQSISGNTFN